jgi:hypothetical protein
MSHFYGTLQGSRGEATRCGTKNSGMEAIAASWKGAIVTDLFIDSQGRDCYVVRQIPWHGVGINEEIARGVIGEES